MRSLLPASSPAKTMLVFFETEEDITVFGGEVVTQMPTTVLTEEDGMDKDDEVTDLLYDDSEEQTDILGEDVATEVLAELYNATLIANTN